MGKDLPTKIIDFNTIIDSIIGQQIKIETSLDVEQGEQINGTKGK